VPANPARTSGSAPRETDREARSRWTSRWVVAIVLLVIALVFIVENRQLTEIRAGAAEGPRSPCAEEPSGGR
jgi:uncharacterized integral membrane protein